MIQTKICGITDEASARAVAECGAEYIGFVFYPRSPRHVTPARAGELKAHAKGVKSVAVVVDFEEALFAALQPLGFDYLQWHGDPARIPDLRKYKWKIIQAIPIRTGDDVAKSNRIVDADMLLFDAKPPELPGTLPGGNGLSFDWALLQGQKFAAPWMLSGGLNAQNVAQAIHLSGAKIVDVSSGVESAPGKKSPDRIAAFIRAAKQTF
jgi:phosphoribosylanthranilate isomerase